MVAFRSLDDMWITRSKEYRAWLASPDSFLLIARTDGVAIGYAVIEVRDEEDGWDFGGPLAEMQSISVAESHRGAGVGTGLVERAREILRARGIRTMLVGVLANNSAAIGFYEHLGLRLWANQYVDPL